MIGTKWTPFNNSIYLGAQLRRSKLHPTTHMLSITCHFFHWPNDLRWNFAGVFVKVNRRNEVSSEWNHHQSSRPSFIKKSFCSMKYSLFLLRDFSEAVPFGSFGRNNLVALMWKWTWWSMATPPQTKTLSFSLSHHPQQPDGKVIGFETGCTFPFECKIWPQLQIWPEPWPSSTLESYIMVYFWNPTDYMMLKIKQKTGTSPLLNLGNLLNGFST